MNKILNKLERKFGRYAIPHLTVYILICYGIGYLLTLAGINVENVIGFNAALICKGQIWRLFTWICTPPEGFSIFIIFMFLFFYWVGSNLENYWGAFRYNLYVFSGIIFMVIGAMLLYLISGLLLGFDKALNISITTYYINFASFLAFATCFPDVQILFMMIIPLKVKWLAIVDVVFLAYEFIAIGKFGTGSQVIGLRYMIIISLLNFIIFFLGTRNYKKISPSEIKRKKKFKQRVKNVNMTTRHKCCVCGRTEEDAPDLQFRFCSKCQGSYEYCQDHIFSHTHITKNTEK